MKGIRVLFGPSPPGVLGGAPIIGFEGKGQPQPRRRLNSDERRDKRAANKAERQRRGR